MTVDHLLQMSLRATDGREFQQKALVLSLGYIFKSFGEISKLWMPGCSPSQLHRKKSLWVGPRNSILNLYPQVTPVCGSAGEPLRHNQRQVGGQATSATDEKVALLVRVRVQSF